MGHDRRRRRPGECCEYPSLRVLQWRQLANGKAAQLRESAAASKARQEPSATMWQLTYELHDEISQAGLEEAFGGAVLLPRVDTLPIPDGTGRLEAWPPSLDSDAEVVLHVETVRTDTGEIVWFAARCGRFSDATAAINEFVADAQFREPGELRASSSTAFDDVLELSPGLWWHPPLLSSLKTVVWRTPIRLLRLIPESDHYCICEMVDHRLTDPGYFEPLPLCSAFLQNWIA
jgi:hypothetical protein